MANEFSLTGILSYEDSEGTEEILQVLEVLASITTKKYVKHKQSIGITEEALDMGELSAPFGFGMFINRDSTNYVELRLAGSGAGNDAIKIPAGKFALFHFGSDITVPYAIANTAPVQLEYIVFAP